MTTSNSENVAAEAGSFLSNLLGLQVSTTESDAPESAAVSATYVDSDEVVRAHIICDLPSAAILGAALTQIPMGRVNDSIKEGKLADNLQENAAEVFNIAVNLLPNHETRRYVLKDVCFCDDSCMPALGDVEQCDDFELDVQRYGKGKMRVVQVS